jgi:hypothetical protein
MRSRRPCDIGPRDEVGEGNVAKNHGAVDVLARQMTARNASVDISTGRTENS